MIVWVFVFLHETWVWTLLPCQTLQTFIEAQSCFYWISHKLYKVSSILVTDDGDQTCWWQVLDVGDRFRMLMTDLIRRENHQNNEKSRQHNDSACQNLPWTSEMSPTSLSPSPVMTEFTRVTLMMKALFDYPSTTFDLENVIFILNWHASWPEYNLQPFISHFKSFAELGIQRICIFYL